MFKYKEFRRAHSLLQSQLADILGMTQSNLSRYETEGVDLTREQYGKLYEKYGKEDVAAFIVDNSQNVTSCGNILHGTGTQNNGIQSDKDMLDIIRKLTETITHHVEKQDEINSRLLTILEKMTLK